MKAKGTGKRLLWIPAVLAGIVPALIVILQVLLNSPVAAKIVDRLAKEYIEGRLNYSRLHFSLVRSFPDIRITADTLLLTYPHDLFSEYDGKGAYSRMLEMGRGEEEDTLACFDRFTAAVNPWSLLGGRIRLSDAHLHSLKVYAHQYNDTTANWNIFRSSPDEEKDTVAGKPVKSLPWISVGEVRIARKPVVIYTSQEDTIFATLGFRKFAIRGDVKLEPESKYLDVREFALRLDTLRVIARLPKDTLGFTLDSLVIANPSHHEMKIEAGARAAAFSSTAGKMRLPIWIKSNIGYESVDGGLRLAVHPFEALIADVPLRIEGTADMGGELNLDARVSIPGGDLSPVVQAYGPRFVPLLDTFPISSRLSLDADIKGVLGEGRLPDVDGNFSLDLSSDGVKLDLDGAVENVLWEDASYSLNAEGYADSEKIASLLPESAGLESSGRLNLTLKVSSNLPELKTFKFKESKIFAKVESPRLAVVMPEDSLRAKVFGTTLVAGAREKGLLLYLNVDTLRFAMGKQLIAAGNGTKASYLVTKVTDKGQTVPRLAVRLDNDRLFARAGVHKLMTDSVHLECALQKHVTGKSRRNRLLDSLRRQYPSASRDSLIGIIRGGDAVSDLDFKGGDVTVKVDSAFSNLFRKWDPSGRISLSKAFVSTPSLPLKTRLNAFDVNFDSRKLVLDTLRLACGTSDINAKGRLSGTRGILTGRKARLKMNLEVGSGRLNLNELIYAFQNRPEVTAEEIGTETEYTAVSDSISAAEISDFSAVVIPSNLQANINLNAARVDFIDLGIRDFNADIKLENRTIQLDNARLNSDYGRIDLDAYYYTKNKADIGCGVDLSIKDVSADGIIHMFKNVGEMMPALRSFEGKLNCDIAGTARLDTNLNVIMPSLDGLIRISGTELNISDAGDLRKITRLLRFKDKNIGRIDNMYVNAVVRDNELTVLPFELGVDRYRLALEGTQGFDMSMHYHVSILKMPFLLFPFGINIYGTPDKWKFSLGAPKYKNGNVPTFTRQLDGVQLNMGKSIKNVLKEGADAAVSEHRKKMEQLSDGVSHSSGSDGGDGVPDSSQMESFAIETAMMVQDEELDAEIEEALSMVIIDTRGLTDFVREKTSRKELKKAQREARRRK